MREMDHIAQNPDLDLKSFFETKGIRMASDSSADSSADTPVRKPTPGAAPPPKDTAWVAMPTDDEEERPSN